MSRPAPSLLRLQLEELGARKWYTQPVRAEIHQYGGLALDIDNAAKAVLIVRHQVTPLVCLGKFLDDGDIKRASRQVPPRAAGARWPHFPTVRAWPAVCGHRQDDACNACSAQAGSGVPDGQFVPLQPEDAAVLLARLARRDDLDSEAGTPPRSTTQLAGAPHQAHGRGLTRRTGRRVRVW
jgi:hypothetical protein